MNGFDIKLFLLRVRRYYLRFLLLPSVRRNNLFSCESSLSSRNFDENLISLSLLSLDKNVSNSEVGINKWTRFILSSNRLIFTSNSSSDCANSLKYN